MIVARDESVTAGPTGSYVDKYTFGTGLLDGHGYWNRYYMDSNVVPRFSSVVPEVSVLVYNYPFITSEPNAIYLYPEDLGYYSSGAIRYFKSGIPVVYPSVYNDYGQAFNEVWDWQMDAGDGIYMDAATMCSMMPHSYDANK